MPIFRHTQTLPLIYAHWRSRRRGYASARCYYVAIAILVTLLMLRGAMTATAPRIASDDCYAAVTPYERGAPLLCYAATRCRVKDAREDMARYEALRCYAIAAEANAVLRATLLPPLPALALMPLLDIYADTPCAYIAALTLSAMRAMIFTPPCHDYLLICAASIAR